MWTMEVLPSSSLGTLRRTPPTCSLSIDLSEHDVERSDDGGDVGQHVTVRQEIHRRKMGEGRRADLTFVWLVGSVRDQEDAEFPFWRLDRDVYLTGWDAVAFRIKLEMLDDRFHRTLHLAASGRSNLVIFDDDWPLSVALRKLFDALFHDAHRLAHLLHPHEIAIVAVAVLADRDIEIEFGIAFVRLCLAQIPRRAGAAHHHA